MYIYIFSIIQQSHIWVCMKIGHPKIPVFFAVIFPSKWPFEGIPNFQTLTCHVMSCSHSFEFEKGYPSKTF